VKPKLLGFSPEAIGSGAHVLDVDITFRAHFAEKFAEGGEDFLDILGLLRLCVCLVDDSYIEVETVPSLLAGQRSRLTVSYKVLLRRDGTPPSRNVVATGQSRLDGRRRVPREVRDAVR